MGACCTLHFVVVGFRVSKARGSRLDTARKRAKNRVDLRSKSVAIRNAFSVFRMRLRNTAASVQWEVAIMFPEGAGS
jgi:hypothetical protein